MAQDDKFRYSLRIDTLRRFSIIRFPNDSYIFNVLTRFAASLPAEDFFSITRTSREVSIIQDAKYPTFSQELSNNVAQTVQVEEGFVAIEVVPDIGGQIDFGIVFADCVLRAAVTGLLAQLAGILAERSIAIFAISTFDTDYILIRATNVESVTTGFENQGIKVAVLRG